MCRSATTSRSTGQRYATAPLYSSAASDVYKRQVLDHAVIGEGAIVAAGSVVLSKTIVEPGSIYAGVPAKFVKKVDPEQAKEINQKIAKNYHMYSSWYKEEH